MERHPRVVVVPIAWLIGLAALVVVPWLVVGALYLGGSGEKAGNTPARVSYGPDSQAHSGPWGQLTVSPIVISPPLEYVEADWGGRTATVDQWYFPGVTGDLLQAFLVSSGLASDAVARVQSASRVDPGIGGLVVTPDPDLVRALDPQVRSRLYGQLAKSRLNFDQANSFRFLGQSPEAWLGGSLISPRTRELVEPLIYRDGEYLHFADVELVRLQIADEEELRRLAKALLRQPTVLVRLTVSDPSEVEALAEYWGRGGRRTDLRPLLESVAGTEPDNRIDITHLLPVFARERLYRYPKLTTLDLDRPLLSNCLWSSLNFFSPQPDDRYLDVGTALDALRRDYFVIQSGFELGDIVAFLDEDGDLFHVAVYLADGLTFTKNGTSPLSPWLIASIDDLKGYYRPRAAQPRLIYHRRNDF